jgi:L-iditol 2-dehydrogenase
MKAAEFLGPGSIGVSECDVPEAGPGWVRVAVSAVGICGTDLHLLGGFMGSEGLRPGHEVAGIVDATGDGVEIAHSLKVAVEPITACGACFQCGTGHHNRCADNRIFGVTTRGGMADYVTVPASCLHVLPAGLDDNVAALSEPMAVCVRAIRLGGVGVGDRVAVLGSGTIGLLSILVARSAGAGEVFVTARYPRQAELARALGATQVFDSAESMLSEVGDQLIDVVIETVGGRAETLTEAVAVASAGATIVMVGVFEGAPSIPGLGFLGKELTLRGSNCYAHDGRVGDFGLATELVARHRDLLPELISHRFGLDQVVEAFAAAADKSAGAIKVQVMPGA